MKTESTAKSMLDEVMAFKEKIMTLDKVRFVTVEENTLLTDQLRAMSINIYPLFLCTLN